MIINFVDYWNAAHLFSWHMTNIPRVGEVIHRTDSKPEDHKRCIVKEVAYTETEIYVYLEKEKEFRGAK
jgi:hypothetical protein